MIDDCRELFGVRGFQNVLIGLGGLMALGFAGEAFSQVTDLDPPSVRTVRGEGVSPTAAMSILQADDGVSGWGFAAVGDQYHAHEDSRFIELAVSLGFDAAEWAGATGADLTALQGRYVDAAYAYAKNHVDFMPLFGLQHGAMGAVYHGSGTSFDHADLLVELMHVANIEAKFQVGTVSPSSADFISWVGTDVPKQACEILASGGVPVTVNGTSNCNSFASYNADPSISVTMVHAWVSIKLDGVDYLFDPSLKTYEYSDPSYDFASKSGLTTSGVLGALGGTSSSNGMEYTGPNPKNLRDYLVARSQALSSQLQADIVPSLTALGGRRLIVSGHAPRQTSLAGYTSNWLSSGAVLPNELMATIEIDLGMGAVESQYSGSVKLPLSKLGVDILIVSPIDITDGGRFSDGTGTFTAVTSKFELSLIRSGESSTEIQGDTGSTNASLSVVNNASGENLLLVNLSLLDTVNQDWVITMEYDAPFAAQSADFGDRKTLKVADKFTSSTLIVSAGDNERFSGRLYERYVPKKTNLWYGLYIDDSLTVTQCQRQRIANFDSMFGGGGFSPIGGPSFGLGGAGCPSFGSDVVSRYATCLSHDEFACTPNLSAVEQANLSQCMSSSMGGTSLWGNGSSGGGTNSSGGGIFVPETACEFTPSNSISRVVSHDKRIRTKSIAKAQWFRDATNFSHMMAGLSQGRGGHLLSLGIVTSSIQHNPDLSFGNDALLIDVDTTLFYAPTSSASKSLEAYGLASAAGLSAVEGLILQNLSGASRVDTAASKTDWYSWNSAYDDLVGTHAGPYGHDGNPANHQVNGSAVFEGFSPGNSLSQIQALVGVGDLADSLYASTQDNFFIARPSRSDLGPVESYEQEGPPQSGETYTYLGRKGRKGTYSSFQSVGGVVDVSHIVGAGKKGGAGVTLPEFDFGELDGEALTKDSYDKLYGMFRIDDREGHLSFAIEDELSLGSQDHNSLSFSRTYESVNVNAGPLGLGWSHNHDAKLVLTTDLEVAFDSISPEQNLASIIAGLAALEIAESGTAVNDWRVLPRTLMVFGWMAHEVFDNQVVVTSGSGSDKFYRQPSGDYFNVDNRTATLDQTGYVNFYEVTKPYMPNLTKQELIDLGAQDPSAASQTPMYSRRFWVVYEQYDDFSGVDFTYTTAGKSVLSFPRGEPLQTDAVSLACFPNTLLPFRNVNHDGAKCGKDAGRWSLSEVVHPNGRKISYTYSNGLLTSVTDDRYGHALAFDYEANPGGFSIAYPSIGDDDPSNPLSALHASNLQPNSSLTQGQTHRLRRVYNNADSTQEVVFYYEDAEPRYSPILTSYRDALGAIHDYGYDRLQADHNSTRDEIQLLTTITPSSLTVPTLTLEYSDTGRVVALVDGSLNRTTYGVNGGRNRVVNGVGSETVRIYSPDGFLGEVMSPVYD